MTMPKGLTDEQRRNWHHESARKRTKAYRERHNRRCWSNKLRGRFGITAEQYEAILASQDGRCAICGRKAADESWRRLHVDHDHATEKIRGLLCANCNRGVGMFRDSPEFLRKAAAYLERL